MMIIIDKNKDYVEPQIYAAKKMAEIQYAMLRARAYGLNKLWEISYGDYKGFKHWSDLPPANRRLAIKRRLLSCSRKLSRKYCEEKL